MPGDAIEASKEAVNQNKQAARAAHGLGAPSQGTKPAERGAADAPPGRDKKMSPGTPSQGTKTLPKPAAADQEEKPQKMGCCGGGKKRS